MENKVEVDYKYMARRESKFNNDFFMNNKDKYHVSVIGGIDAASAAYDADWNVRMPESVGKYLEDEIVTLVCNSNAYQDGPQYEANEFWDRIYTMYSGLIILDIGEAQHAKCKLLGIETRAVLSYEIRVIKRCPIGTVSREIRCSIMSHGAIDDGVLDAFKSRAVTLK